MFSCLACLSLYCCVWHWFPPSRARPPGGPFRSPFSRRGDITLELYPDEAPATEGNFLSYVDQGLYNDAEFYRVLRLDNDRNPTSKVTYIQGGLNGKGRRLAPVAHETTAQTWDQTYRRRERTPQRWTGWRRLGQSHREVGTCVQSFRQAFCLSGTASGVCGTLGWRGGRRR